MTGEQIGPKSDEKSGGTNCPLCGIDLYSPDQECECDRVDMALAANRTIATLQSALRKPTPEELMKAALEGAARKLENIDSMVPAPGERTRDFRRAAEVVRSYEPGEEYRTCTQRSMR